MVGAPSPAAGARPAPEDPAAADPPWSACSRAASSGTANEPVPVSPDRRPDRHHLPNTLTPRTVVGGSIQGGWGLTARRDARRRLPARESPASLLGPCPAPGGPVVPAGTGDQPPLDLARPDPGPVRDG